MIKVLDLFDNFESLYNNSDITSGKDLLALWRDSLASYPEITENCIDNVLSDGILPEQICTDHLLPILKNKWDEFYTAHQNIKSICLNTIEKINSFFPQNNDDEIYAVFYVGLCNGAGWVDKFNNKRAVYFGLEQIVDLGWYNFDFLETLIVHEFGHVYHFSVRAKNNIPVNYNYSQADSIVWRIYEEGFAERFTYLITSKSTFKDDEIKNMDKNFSKLVNIYYTYFSEEKKIYDFFGDWFSIDGMSRTGYYLGMKMIERIEKDMNFEDISLLGFDDIKKYFNIFITENCVGSYDDYTVLSPYSVFWPSVYSEIAMIITGVSPGNITGVYHIGSTSVPGMTAKPIIDIMVTYSEGKDIITEDFKDIFEYLGENGVPGREFFKYKKSGKTISHIHLVHDDSALLKSHILFRERLIGNRKYFDMYMALKLKLEKEYKNNRQLYTEFKSELINKILE